MSDRTPGRRNIALVLRQVRLGPPGTPLTLPRSTRADSRIQGRRFHFLVTPGKTLRQARSRPPPGVSSYNAATRKGGVMGWSQPGGGRELLRIAWPLIL